jgi:hypothetical protein
MTAVRLSMTRMRANDTDATTIQSRQGSALQPRFLEAFQKPALLGRAPSTHPFVRMVSPEYAAG